MIETMRLRLRRWRMAEARAFKAIAGEPRVARFLGPGPTLARARAIIAAQNAMLDATGHCFWAIEARDSPVGKGEVFGWCGIKLGPDHSPIAGLPEIGWTLHPNHQRQGLATEAACAVRDWTWAHTDHPRLHAITTPANTASRAVMTRIGMTRVEDGDFDHPALAAGDPLRRHVTYAIDRP